MAIDCPKCGGTMRSFGPYYECDDNDSYSLDSDKSQACRYRQVRTDFRVREENRQKFEAAMQGLAKRAKRIGVTAPTYEFGAAEDVPARRNNNSIIDGVFERFWPCTVLGEAPKYAGWSFLATIQHVQLDDGTRKNLLRRTPGQTQEIPARYKDAASDCDHCNHRRRRNDTYLLLHEDGTVKQVGSTCLKDFLGHGSPATLAAMAELLYEAMEIGEESECAGGSGRQRYSVLHFLSYVSASMRQDGWCSRKKAQLSAFGSSTADRAYASMVKPNSKDALRPTEEDDARAAVALEWAQRLHETNDLEGGGSSNDYLYNVNVVARCTILGDRQDGIAASIISAYERSVSQELEQRTARLVSKHVGEIGKRQVFNLTITAIRELESQQWGATYLHMMVDADGNRFKWFASSEAIGEVGDTVSIKGTIKNHDEYKGVAQTTLSRCMLYAEKVKPPKKPRASRKSKTEAAEPPETQKDDSTESNDGEPHERMVPR